MTENKYQNLELPQSQNPRIVIIGGGFAGLALAKKLRDLPFQVVLLDRHNYHTFQPLLYQVATGGLEPDSIAFPLRKIFKGYKNLFFRLASFKKVNPKDKTIDTDLGSLSYDHLVLALGSKTNFFGDKNIIAHSSPMKTVPQALDLRSLILQNLEEANLASSVKGQENLINFVVVGGGPTGVETAGALGELKKHILPNDYPELDIRKMKVYLIEGSPRLLNGMSEQAGKKACKFLEQLDVKVWLNTGVKTYDGKTLELNDTKSIGASTVIWAAGVMGHDIDGLPNEVIARGNRIKVDDFNKVHGFEDIYVLGDLAFMQTPLNPHGHPMVAPVAIQQAKNLGDNFKKQLKNNKLKPFKYFSQGSMATVGRNRAVVDAPGFRFQGVFAWFVWMFVHLLSLAGFRNKMVVFVNWVWNYFSYDRGARLIIRPYKRKTENDKEI